MRWASRIIAAMMCSMTMTVRPSAWRRRIRSTMPPSSVGLSPAITSSSRRTRGRVASARDLEALAQSDRQRPGPGRGVRREVARLDHALGVGAGGANGRRARQGADHHVVEDGEIAERLDDLERPREAEPADVVGRAASHVAAREDDASLFRAVVAGDHVEERRLAGAVWADDADQLALAYVQRDGADGRQAAEALGDVLKREHAPLGRRPPTARAAVPRFPSGPGEPGGRRG